MNTDHLQSCNSRLSTPFDLLKRGKKLLKYLVGPYLRFRSRIKSTRNWENRGFSSPAPHHVKMSVLSRYEIEGAAWVETGTYLGDTTAYLASRAPYVWTIEPSFELAQQAKARLSKLSNIAQVIGLSEEKLSGIVAGLHEPLNFWFDGHFSSGMTFRGPVETPIIQELAVVGENLSRLGDVAVFIDDIRMFDPAEYPGYPSKDYLVEWAQANRLWWAIEHDIFIARSRYLL